MNSASVDVAGGAGVNDSSFDILKAYFPSLAECGRQAELLMSIDLALSMQRIGLYSELFVQLIISFEGFPVDKYASQKEKLDFLARHHEHMQEMMIPLNEIRKKRNAVSHSLKGIESKNYIAGALQFIYSIGIWLVRVYKEPTLHADPYKLPKNNLQLVDESYLKKIEEELADKDIRLAQKSERIATKELNRRAQLATSLRHKTEQETRQTIDAQLRAVGWQCDTETLRYSKGARPEKGKNKAIAEWPTSSALSAYGRADYALFIGEQLIAFVEAKAEHQNVSTVVDGQARDYSSNVRQQDAPYLMGQWGSYRVPFVFATNGRAYLEQYAAASGIWFHNLTTKGSAPRALKGWPSPDGLMRLFNKDIRKAEEELSALGDGLLTDPDGLNLRDYQIRAIHATEDAIVRGEQRVLLAMATGTGKTRTVLGMIYRLLKTQRFNRILFLVDRTALGSQAMDTFTNVKLEDLHSLDEIYTINRIDDTELAAETRVHIATVQGMVRRIFDSDAQSVPAVTDYDLIIVDEAHRGYTLDREMTDDDMFFRDQRDYQSAYRRVIDYFDARVIGLTATPALHTTQIFGQPVFTYSYREAVLEGYLVDHDAPHVLKTKLSTEGIHFKQGDSIPIYDPLTGEVTNSTQLVDELDFNVEQFNKKVITEPFNRTVLAEIANYLDPEFPGESGKTLIYAASDAHADMVVNILRDIFSERGVPTEAVMKITGAAGGGNRKRLDALINRFKNEDYPSVVVTVDLLTTGIDVPEITNLVFLRSVKSRILFEQMLGRATRLCPAIGKQQFQIFDPVGIYESLDAVSTLNPVGANPKTTFAHLIDGLQEVPDEEGARKLITQIVAKLQRKKQVVTPEIDKHIAALSKGQQMQQSSQDAQSSVDGTAQQDQCAHDTGIDSVIELLKNLDPTRAAEWIIERRELFDLLDQLRSTSSRYQVLSDHHDELVDHSRDYGVSQRPQDYLKEFADYINTHINEVLALKIICTRPADLTREDLKDLCLALDREGFTEKKLSSAYGQLSNKEISADIISLIRQAALGEPLLPHSERVERAVERLMESHAFTVLQKKWLNRIKDYLQNELLLTTATFDQDARFKERGGSRKLDKTFNGNLAQIIDELNTYMYQEDIA